MATLKELLEKLEEETLKEYEVYQQLITINDTEHNIELEAEKLAFSISDHNTIIDSSQGFPEYERERIFAHDNLEEFIVYWYKRSKKTTNSILKLRYCKLYLEFFSKFKKIKFDKTVVEDLVNAIKAFENVNKKTYILHTLMYHLNYAMYASIKFNQDRLITYVKQSILNYCDRFDLIEKQGVWYTIYIMMLRNIEKTHLSNNEVNTIMSFLNKLLTIENSPYEIIRLADLICEYYRRNNKEDRIKSTLNVAFERLSQFKSSGLGVSNLFMGFNSIANKYQFKELESKILKKIEDNGESILKEMQPKKIPIPQKLQDDFTRWQEAEKINIETLLNNNPFEKIVINYLLKYLPRKADIQKDKEKNSSLFDQLAGVVVQSSLDKDGVPVRISNGFENENSLLIKWLVERMFLFSNQFLQYSMSILFANKVDALKSLSGLVNKSNLFRERHKMIIIKAIKAYFEDDYIISIHLLIPQIEDILRNLLSINGGKVRKPNEYGGFDMILLHQVLRSEELISFLGDDIILYFNSILCHRFGYNVRNQVCHGLLENFNSIIALRLIHISLILTMIEVKENEN